MTQTPQTRYEECERRMEHICDIIGPIVESYSRFRSKALKEMVAAAGRLDAEYNALRAEQAEILAEHLPCPFDEP